MLAFAIFAVTFVVALILLIVYIYTSSKNPSTIPGLDPVSREFSLRLGESLYSFDKQHVRVSLWFFKRLWCFLLGRDGNLGDIAKAGSLHEFLVDLHRRFGSIASFWWGPNYVVSTASTQLFQEHHHLFDRPILIIKLFEPLYTLSCVSYVNGSDGRQRRKQYDKCLTSDAIKPYFLLFQEVAEELCKKWERIVTEEHIPLSQYMSAYALKCALGALFGNMMKDDKKVMEFRQTYDIVWGEMELRLKEEPTEAREETFQKGKLKLREFTRRMVDERKKNPPQHGECTFLDLLLDYTDNEDIQYADALQYVIAGFHTTGNMLTWGFYYLASNPEVQEKVYQEIKDVLGKDDVDHTNIGDLKYLRQVLEETIRCAVIAPYTARFQDVDSELGGHKIPKNTPVIHALGVVAHDKTIWPLPDKFDPDRFSKENSKHRSHLASSGFGFAGKRVCPGQKFAFTEGTIAMVTLLRKFKVNFVEGQVIERIHGLVTHPSEEVWITLSKR